MTIFSATIFDADLYCTDYPYQPRRGQGCDLRYIGPRRKASTGKLVRALDK